MCPQTARAPNHVARWKGPNPPRAGPAHPAGFVSVHLLEGPVTCIGSTILHAAGLADARGIGSSTIIRSRRNSKRIGPRILVNKSDSLSSVLTFTSLHNPLSRSACTQSCRQSMCRIFDNAKSPFPEPVGICTNRRNLNQPAGTRGATLTGWCFYTSRRGLH